MKFPPAYTGTGVPPPPSSSYAGRSASFPAISQSAISAPQPRPRAREDDVWRARIASHDEARERLGHDRVRDVRVLAAPTVADLAVPDHAGVGLDLHEAMGEERGPERVRGAALRRFERHRDRDRGEPRDRGHARSVSC